MKAEFAAAVVAAKAAVAVVEGEWEATWTGVIFSLCAHWNESQADPVPLTSS